MPTKLVSLLDSFRDYIHNASAREKLLLAGLLLTGILIGGYSLVESIHSKLSQQSARLLVAKENSARLGKFLQQYQSLLARKTALERDFEGAYQGLPARSYIEQIATDKADLQTSVDITQTSEDAFGENFRRTNFRVTFQTSSLERLSTFLKEVDQGTQPLLLTRLEIHERIPRRLSVSLDLSSIEAK